MLKHPNEPTDEETGEAQLEPVGKATIHRLREQHGMSRTMSRGINDFLFPGGHPGAVALRLLDLVCNHTRRDD